MSETGRWALPLLDAGQAQKEITHNEALARLDLLTQATVVAVGSEQPPTDPGEGQCWVTGAAAAGAWAGQPGVLAGWTAGGWRFVAPCEGSAVWNQADGCSATYANGEWHRGRIAGAELVIGGTRVVGGQRPAIPGPSGGATVDGEARAVLTQILAALAAHGLIAG